jgi:sulfur-oxidizing protein SoxB
MRRLGAGLLLALLAALLVHGETITLSFLYTNDVHVHLERLESLGRLIAAERAKGFPVLLLDAGDTWQDFRRPLPIVWGAEEMLAWMNEVGYDAMTVGNHELYLGADRLAALAGRADFPLLAANLRPVEGHAPFRPAMHVSAGGVDVLVIGLLTGDSFPALEYPWLALDEPEVALERVLAEDGGMADLVVALGHLPVRDAVQIASRVPGVDVFITGHSHEAMPEPIRAGETLVVQSGEFGEALGRLRLEIDAQGAIVQAENTLLRTEEAPVALDRGYLTLFRILFGVAALTLLLLF